ncbi:MAG: glycosyltransferase [Candidatus Bathyarchaeia archaeon]
MVENLTSQSSVLGENSFCSINIPESGGVKGISVLIPTFNPDISDIREILEKLAKQDYPFFEVIIANDGRDFYSDVADILSNSSVFHYRNNNCNLGLYGSIKENMQYCRYDHILVLEQDIVPISSQYLTCLNALLESSPDSVVTSKLVIAANTDYKKYIFYKRRIKNLQTFDRQNVDLSSNRIEETEIAFTKADLLDKHILAQLFLKGSINVFTAQDIILTSIVHENKKLVTSDATACEIGLRDPWKTGFFLRKELLYGTSVLDAWRHSNKNWLISTSYFREKVSRVLFVGFEVVAFLVFFLSFLLGASVLPVVFLGLFFGIAFFYSQMILVQVGFWSFWLQSGRRLSWVFASGFFVVLLDVAYALGILRRLM